MNLNKKIAQSKELDVLISSFLLNFYNSNIEIWKDLQKFDNKYSVSNFGNVKNNETHTIYKGDYVNGYHRVDLKDNNGIIKHYKVHRLVCDAFHNNLHNKPIVDHINGDKSYNHIKNLRFVTHCENKCNSKKPINNTSGYKGVTFCRGKYTVGITFKNKYYYLGRYSNIEEAVKVRRNKAIELFGEYINVCELN